MGKSLVSALALFIGLSSAAQAQDAFPATLKAHAELPGASFVPAPKGAADTYNVSGRFTAGARVEDLYANFQPATGLALPFPGQPLQGFSGIRSLGNDRFLVLTDNGFGNQKNSSDVVLMFNIVKADWDAGRVMLEKTVQLSDPNRIVPFPIVNEATEGRLSCVSSSKSTVTTLSWLRSRRCRKKARCLQPTLPRRCRSSI